LYSYLNHPIKTNDGIKGNEVFLLMMPSVKRHSSNTFTVFIRTGNGTERNIGFGWIKPGTLKQKIQKVF